MSYQINLNVGKGFTFIDNELALNMQTSEIFERRLNGLYAHDTDGDPGRSGSSAEDNYTIIKDAHDHLQTNSNVVEYIFSMNAYKVIERTRGSTDTYSVDTTQEKDTQDIINELNASIDAGNGTNNGGMFILKVGNLLQLKTSVSSTKLSSWPVAIDSLKRETTDECKALFYIKAITYSDTHPHPHDVQSCYVRTITLTCLYSSFASFVKGTDYTANSIHQY